MADDDDLERLRRYADGLNRAVTAAHELETTATSGDVTVTARGGRLVDVALPPATLVQGGAAEAHRDLVSGIREAAADALRRSNEQLRDAARAAADDVSAPRDES